MVAPKIAVVNRQAIGKSEAKGGNFGWIHSLRRLLATKLVMENMIAIVDVVIDKSCIAGILNPTCEYLDTRIKVAKALDGQWYPLPLK